MIFIDEISLLEEVPSKINQEILFIDTKSLKVHEHYKINNQNIKNQLGYFNQSSLEYVPVLNDFFLNRRKDFQGYKVKSMTDDSGSLIQITKFLHG